MKILLTTDTFYPMVNGVVISTHNLYKELKTMGHEVKILALSEDGRERLDGDIYYLKSFNLKIYPGAKFKKFFNTEIFESIFAWKPDIIHSQTEFSTMFDAKYIARRLRIPHIHTYHTMYEDYLDYIFNGKIIRPGAMSLFLKLLLNSLEGVVAPTNKVKEALINYGVRKNIYTIPTGIDLSNFQKTMTKEEELKLKAKYNIYPKDKVLLYLGRIAQEKNIDEIINVFSNLRCQLDEMKLLIVGSGPYIDNLKELVASENLTDKVIFTGMVKPQEVYKYYKISDVFVTASTSETQGLTYIEALSSGLPVICRYDPCIEGVVEHKKNGLIYKNQMQFENSIKAIVKDSNFAHTLAENSKNSADKFSSRTFARRVEQVYFEVIDNYMFLIDKHLA